MSEVTSNNGEVYAVLLQDKNTGRYVWAAVHDRGGDNTPEIIGEYANSADAKDAAWTYAQEHGATMVYLRLKGVRS